MMLTIHGLPINTTYQDLKRLIRQECNITDFILDSLVMDDDRCKKVRIGVTDDADGSQLMKCLNGFNLLGHVLRIVPVGKPGQQGHSIYDARGNYQQRNDYHNQPHNNFGNHPISHDVQGSQRISAWTPNVQWEQNVAAQVQQSTFTNQPQQPIPNNNFTQPQVSRGPGLVPVRMPQGFGYPPKNTMPERPIPPMKDNFQGINQYGHRPAMAQVFQNQSHVQPQPWQQVQPVKPLEFNKPAPGGYNQEPFNDNHSMPPKQAIVTESGYKDYDKGDRRFDSQTRAPSPGRRMSPRRLISPGHQGRRMSPGPHGRRMSPVGPHGRRVPSPGPQRLRMSPPGPLGRRTPPPGVMGRRMSPPGLHGRRMSPPGPHGRRMSPPGPHGRRMSPSGPQGRRMSPPGSQGRRMSPPGPAGRQMSPIGPHGRRMSPPGSLGRRMSPTGLHGRRMSPSGPHGRRVSPPGPQGRRSPPNHQGRRMSPPGSHGRRMSPPGPHERIISPSALHERRMSPSAPHGRRMSPGPLVPPARRVSPSGPHGPYGRRISPTGPSGPTGPPGRRLTPGRRSPPPMGGPIQSRGEVSTHGSKISPGSVRRRMSPSGPYGHRMTPTGPHGQRMSPHGISGRRMSPGRREPSPSRRMSPTNRRMPGRQSPGRRASPKRHSPTRHRSPLTESSSAMREYQPSFHQAKKAKYDDDERPPLLKQVRPAYEPSTKAPNQAMYSGGYRPNVHDDVPYPSPNTRPEPWQQNTEKPANYPPPKNLDNRIEKFDIPRGSEHVRMGDVEQKRSRSGTRDSRSPTRRDRSPFKDRYRRHSPSPRSPRRSWALEKRRSPIMGEAPPPPVWPVQNFRDPDFPRQNRPKFPDVPENMDKKHIPTWEHPTYEDKNEAIRREKGPDTFTRNNPNHGEKWKPILSSKEPPRDNYRQDERFPENRDAHNYGAKESFGRQSATERMPYTDKRDFRDYPLKNDDRNEMQQKKDIPLRRDEFARREDDRREIFRSNHADLNMEIEDVYKRVAELGKKAEEYRKKENRFEDRGDEFFNQNEDTMNRGRDDRRDFPDARFQAGDKEERSRQTDNVEKTGRQRESRWSSTDKVWRARPPLSSPIKAKREKAAEELTRRIMNRFQKDISENQKIRVRDELLLTFKRLFYDMFKNEDVSYIELIIKFNKKYDANDEAKIFEEVISSFSSNYRKRPALDQPDVAAKTSKRSPDPLIKDVQKEIQFNSAPLQPVQEWNINMIPGAHLPVNPAVRTTGVPAIGPLNMPYILNPTPMMVPSPFAPTFDLPPHQVGLIPNQKTNSFNLYLCKDDFQPFDDFQANELKTFLVSQMIIETDASRGWAPDFIVKGLQNAYRYEILTQDERSKDWLMNLDFQHFYAFNVLVYTDEELWYERAAIWLPGHSRCRHIEPLQKLKLQNSKLQDICIGKWKFVKKVVTVKGTRIYVDIPPSAARALENYNMMISYELQKVSVFPKAAAIDKDVFDAGLNELSVSILPSTQSAMPSLCQDGNIVKIGIKGNKHTNLATTRKMKDMIVYQLFQYLMQGGNSRTDFLKYGFCSPGYLGVVPENVESRRWLVGLNIGTLNRQSIVVFGGDEINVKYIKMYIMLPNEHNLVNGTLACERLKQSNQGVKGINFNAWKNAKISGGYEGKTRLEVHMDLESVETIAKLNYELDYVDDSQDCLNVVVKSDCSYRRLEELIKKYRAEMTDTYDVANMEIASDSDDDVICLD